MTRFVLLLCLALFVVGCDSEETTRPDADLFAGVWTGTTLNVRTLLGTVPVYSADDAQGTLTATFTESGSFTFDLNVEEGGSFELAGVEIPLTDFTVSGTYAVDDSRDEITLTLISTDQGDLSGSGDYEFNGDNRLELSIEDPELVTALIGLADSDITLPNGTIRGGSISLQRGS